MPTNVDIGERLRSERTRLRVTQAAFAEAMRVSKNTQNNYENGSRSPDANYLAEAAQAGIDVDYVITGRRSQNGDVVEGFVLVPRLLVQASAGPGAVNGNERAVGGLCFSREWLAKRHLTTGQLRVIQVRGDSMQPMLTDGDQVLIDMADTHPRSGATCVLRQGDELLVKNCQMLPGGVLRVSSSNPAYSPYDVELEKQPDVSIIGRVVASMHEW